MYNFTNCLFSYLNFKELTMSVGCGIVGNSRRSSDLLITPVSLFWKDKRIHTSRSDEQKIESECQ